MHFIQTFWVLLIKDLLIARRSPIWTALQLAPSIAMTCILAVKHHSGGEVLKDLHASSKTFETEHCSECDLYYTNTGKDRTAIQSVIDSIPWRTAVKFQSKAELLKQLEHKAGAVGIAFESLSGNNFTYHVHTIDVKSSRPFSGMQDAKRNIPVFSSETQPDSYSLTDEGGTEKDVKAGIIKACLVAAKEKKAKENGSLFEYAEIYAYFMEHSSISDTFELLRTGVPLVLGPVMIYTSMSVATEKESGMTGFLAVMGLKRTALFLETLAFSFFKMFIVSIVSIAPELVSLPGHAVAVALFSTTLLCTGVATMAMLCAAATKAGSSALTLSMLLFMALIYVNLSLPNVYEPNFLYYICLIDIFAAHGSFLHGVRLCYVRDSKNIVSLLFAYEDVVNTGVSLLFLIFDIFLMMGLIVVFDYMSVGKFLALFTGFIVDDKTVSENSENYESSWKEEHQGTGEPALVLDSVSKIWETTGEVAVKHFSMEAYSGQVTVLLGHNGAGKSTTYAMISGTTPATKGNITVLGTKLSNGICADRPILGYCPQSNCVYNVLTVEDHLHLFFILKEGRGYWKDEADILCMQLGLANLKKKRAGNLSGGEKRKLCLAMAFIGGSELVMLDEPTAGMDPQSRILVKKMIDEKKKDTAIVLTSHYLDEADAVGDFVYIMQSGRCVCRGTPYFLKSKFAPEIILTVVFAQDASKTDVESTDMLIRECIEGVETGVMNGSQVRFKLPRNQQNRLPELFASLENAKSLCIASFGLSVNALEEAFLKVGEIKGAVREVSETFTQDPDITELHEDRLAIISQQVWCICMKKFFDTIHNVSLIINQWILPIILAVVIALILQENPKEAGIKHAPDMSLRRVKHGRFLIFDPTNNIKRRNLLEQVLRKYPKLQVSRYNRSDYLKLWPREYPWAVGGAIIKSEGNVSEEENPYTWLVASYLLHKEEMLFQLISDVEFAEGQLWMRTSFSSITIEVTSSLLNSLTASCTFFFACVLFNASFVVLPLEERVSNFRHQQILAGLSPVLFWITTFALDTSITVAVMVLIQLFLFLFNVSLSWIFLFYSCVFNISMIPFAYVLSLFVDGTGRAKFLCILYEICSAWCLMALHFEKTNITLFARIFPCVGFLSMTIDELVQLKIEPVLPNGEAVLAFLLHGVLFFMFLFAYEFHVERSVLRIAFKIAYEEKNEVPDEEDVIEERDAVRKDASKFALAVQDLTKYYGSYCAVKRTTYGVRAEDCFGLVGANGAGKTTTFDIITGLRYQNYGEVHIGNEFVNRFQKIGYCPQFDAMSPRLSCKQNMIIIAGLVGYKKPKLIVNEMLSFLNITEHCNKAFNCCSGGQKRRVNIGAALLNPSKLVILDEPTAGIDPETRRHVWSLLKRMRVSGKAILLSSHSMEECEALCSRIGILVRGRLVAIGASQALKSRYADSLFLHMILKSLKDRELVINEVLTKFESGTLTTKRTDSLNLKFKICRGPRDHTSTLYAEVQKIASHLPLNDFFLLESSLEDVLENVNEMYSGKIL